MLLDAEELKHIIACLEAHSEVWGDGEELRINYDGFSQVRTCACVCVWNPPCPVATHWAWRASKAECAPACVWGTGGGHWPPRSPGHGVVSAVEHSPGAHNGQLHNAAPAHQPGAPPAARRAAAAARQARTGAARRPSASRRRALQAATECLTQLGAVVGPLFSASTFLKFDRNGSGTIPLHLFSQYISMRNDMQRMVSQVVSLGCGGGRQATRALTACQHACDRDQLHHSPGARQQPAATACSLREGGVTRSHR